MTTYKGWRFECPVSDIFANPLAPRTNGRAKPHPSLRSNIADAAPDTLPCLSV
jgi:hypothetical protein